MTLLLVSAVVPAVQATTPLEEADFVGCFEGVARLEDSHPPLCSTPRITDPPPWWTIGTIEGQFIALWFLMATTTILVYACFEHRARVQSTLMLTLRCITRGLYAALRLIAFAVVCFAVLYWGTPVDILAGAQGVNTTTHSTNHTGQVNTLFPDFHSVINISWTNATFFNSHTTGGVATLDPFSSWLCLILLSTIIVSSRVSSRHAKIDLA